MSKKRINNTTFAQWLPKASHANCKRCVGVSVARKVAQYHGVVTVELYGIDRAEELDEARPTTWGGSESATLTPNGARALAELLNNAADEADALLASVRAERDAAESKAADSKAKD